MVEVRVWVACGQGREWFWSGIPVDLITSLDVLECGSFFSLVPWVDTPPKSRQCGELGAVALLLISGTSKRSAPGGNRPL